MCLYSRFRSRWRGDIGLFGSFFGRFGLGLGSWLLQASTRHRDSSDSTSAMVLTLTTVRRERSEDTDDILPHFTDSSRDPGPARPPAT